ncbi:hypothetical protein ACIA5G_05425 [Amycolatopsis sp. NPDC051758]|uniref:hypothetical protein n=1 Tax=Amycolatopsis sp. NPDC051758 TaxID=3363935 RepID=UPI0037891221
MALAALIVSILALLAAGASAYYGRQQAAAAEAAAESAAVSAQAASDTARVDNDRRHEERAPKISPGELRDHGSGTHILHFRLLDSPELIRVDAEIVDSHGINFRPGTDGTAPAGHPVKAFYLPEFDYPPGRLRLTTGDGIYWPVELDDVRSNQIHIRLTCHTVDDEAWTIHREI